jgi:hypothetical protein
MTERDAVTDHGWESGIRVKDRTVLNVHVMSDGYGPTIGTQNATEPHVRAGTEGDRTDDHRAWRDESRSSDVRGVAEHRIDERIQALDDPRTRRRPFVRS